jgi:hypothetical protein
MLEQSKHSSSQVLARVRCSRPFPASIICNITLRTNWWRSSLNRSVESPLGDLAPFVPTCSLDGNKSQCVLDLSVNTFNKDTSYRGKIRNHSVAMGNDAAVTLLI